MSRVRTPLLAFAPIPVGLLLLLLGHARDPLALHLAQSISSPSGAMPLGTDPLGRDVLARLLVASGAALIGLYLSLGVSTIIGVTGGSLMGWTAGSWFDKLGLFVIDTVFVIPTLLVLLALFTSLEPSTLRTYLALGVVGAAGPARVTRNELARLRQSPVAIAQRALGFSTARLLLVSLLPLSASAAVRSMTTYVPELLGYEVGLGFFGLGTPPPTPSLGRMLYDGLNQIHVAWWLWLGPAVTAILIGVLLRSVLLAVSAGDRKAA